MLLVTTSNGVGVNVRMVGYGLSKSGYQGIYSTGCAWSHAAQKETVVGMCKTETSGAVFGEIKFL